MGLVWNKKLRSQTRGLVLSDRVAVARSFRDRGQGLLGTPTLQASQALWIVPCSSVHTFFMGYSIDCVFLSRELRVVKLVEHVQPFRFASCLWQAESVLEMASGSIDRLKIAPGEVMYVGD